MLIKSNGSAIPFVSTKSLVSSVNQRCLIGRELTFLNYTRKVSGLQNSGRILSLLKSLVNNILFIFLLLFGVWKEKSLSPA
jgi:hypothetical protein